MLRCSDIGREWVGRRVQGAQEVCFLGTALDQPIEEGPDRYC